MSGGALRSFTPRAGVRVQVFSAAIMWLVGASILIVRGVAYLEASYWHAWGLAVALALGVLKARFVLDRVAGKAIERIRARGRACYFGFFSWRSWLLVALMMGGGIAIRRLVDNPGELGLGIMGAVYLGVGTALFLADRLFWRAFVELFQSAEA